MEALQSPLLIAMKDDSGSTKIARELAAFLKYPLIDQYDASLALQKSTKTRLPNELKHNLPFETVYQFALTQLSLKINVIINCELSQTDRLYKLLNLAISEKARFVIIECTTKDKKDNEYEDGRIPKLRVDIKSFDVKKLVSDMLVLLSDKERDDTLKVIESHAKNKKKVRQPVIDHLHALALSEKASKNELVCKSCSKLLSGPSYQCVDCEDFNLHKFCAESAPNLDKCPPFLRTVKPDQYAFRRTHKCGNCEEFLDDCCDCLLQTHLNHGFLPTILHSGRHKHFLNFIIMPFKYNYQYKCCVCDKLGSSVSYKCYDCFYDIHVNCALPDLIIKTKNSGHRFFLVLNSSSDGKPGSKHQCDICNREIDLSQPFYRCSMLDLQFHLKCTPDERQVDVLISNKKLTRVYEDFEPTWDLIERSEDYFLYAELPGEFNKLLNYYIFFSG
ncbi:hypothetical protein P3X46_000349 [Hevea brasiliensis]|uniref:DC1 domain-containing protein n=1 Tax=Hevea brasiliensis TaxID=3981 RepID=A0ABQ9NBJ9_HEVBR|nr:hypothetical protein P3X46_000349 [Hevea brasiliensis]